MSDQLDPNASKGEQGAEQLQNSAMVAEIEFIKMLAELFSKLTDHNVEMKDITIKYGANKTIWPSDPDVEILAKIKEAMSDPESKLSFRILVEDAQGNKEKLYHQTAGKVVHDPYHMRAQLQDMLVQNILQAPAEAETQVQEETQIQDTSVDHSVHQSVIPSSDDDYEPYFYDSYEQPSPIDGFASIGDFEDAVEAQMENQIAAEELNRQEYIRLLGNTDVPEHLKEFISNPNNLESMAKNYPERSKELDWVVARQARAEGMDEFGIAAVIGTSPYTKNAEMNEARSHVHEIQAWAYSDRMDHVYAEQGESAQQRSPSQEPDRFPPNSMGTGQSTWQGIANNLQEQLVVTRQQLQSLEGQVKYLSQAVAEMSSNPSVHEWLQEAKSVFEQKSESLKDKLKNKLIVVADKVASKAIGVSDRLKESHQKWSYNTPLLMERAIDSLMKPEYGAQWTDKGTRIDLGDYAAVQDSANRSRYIEDNKSGQVIWRDCIQAEHLTPQQTQFLQGFNRTAEVYVAKANKELQQQQQSSQQHSKPQPQQPRAFARAR
jgi:hypothetical protein